MVNVLFGAAYYHEYQPYERLDTDLDLMAAAGFTVIRVGESVWSTWEPDDGVFDLEWIQPILDGAHARGIQVMLGTPTYAVPAWLRRRYPEITGERATGVRIPWGVRQEADFTHPAYRFHAERVVRAIVTRHSGHPAIIGYQVDNEPGMELLHNHGVFDRFIDDLRQRYGSVEALNDEWGLTYWSHRLSRWDDLWIPDGNTTPAYALAWRRFQAKLTTEFIGWQADIVRELKRPDQFVTTCIDYPRPAVDDVSLAARLDITTGNTYYATQDTLTIPPPAHPAQGHAPPFAEGVWRLYFSADRVYASRQEHFLVTETNATSVGASHVNYPGYDGQWRQAAWALVSRGARMVGYWHWHTLHFGHETYWGGILGHSLEPSRTYAEIARIGAELRGAGDDILDLHPDADVAVLTSVDSRWAMEQQPPLATPTGEPDRDSYDRTLGTFYQALFHSGLQVRLVSPAQLDSVQDIAVLVVPALYIADDATLDWLDGYARAGGHLVLSFRSGYADHEARPRSVVAPGRLREAVGAHYLEYSSLTNPIRVVSSEGSPLALPDTAHATAWADGLIVDDAQSLAEYEHPHFGRWSAATTREHGAGRVTYVGTLPDQSFANALAEFIAPVRAWGERPESVTVSSAVNAAGRRIWFVHNWSWHPVSVPTPALLTDVLSGEPVGDSLDLGPWDVRVLTSL